MVIDYL
jgi:hypothetical protein